MAADFEAGNVPDLLQLRMALQVVGGWVRACWMGVWMVWNGLILLYLW